MLGPEPFTTLGGFTKTTDSFSNMFDKFGKVGDLISGVFNTLTDSLALWLK